MLMFNVYMQVTDIHYAAVMFWCSCKNCYFDIFKVTNQLWSQYHTCHGVHVWYKHEKISTHSTKTKCFCPFFSIKKYLCHDRHLHTLTHCFWRLSEEWSIFVWSAAFKLAKWRPCLIGWTFSLLSSQLLVSWSIFNHSKFSAAHAHYKMMYVCRTRCKISLSFATFSVHSLA